jgi:hypothetical protein
MTPSGTWLASAAVIALLFGLEFPNPQLTGEPSPLPTDHTMVFAADEARDGQAQAQTEKKAGESVTKEEEAKRPEQAPGAHPSYED